MLSAAEIGPIPAETPKPVETKTQSTGDVDAAIASIRKIKKPDKNDGSARLYAYCCRCREYGLSLDQTIAAIRLIAIERPFPTEWSDDDIEQRWIQVARKVDVGSAIERGPGLYEPEGRSDAANARRFVARFRSQIRWCDAWGKWLIWDGCRWVVDETCQIDAFAKQYAHSLWRDIGKIIGTGVDDGLRKALNAFGKQGNSAAGIANMLRLARSEPGISIRPNQMDTDRWKLNCKNGTIDLRTGKLLEHCREDFITKLVPVDYDPAAECPLFVAFLEGIFGGKKTLIDFIQRLLGYSITGDVSEQIAAIFWGEGSNGKSTFLGVLMVLLADYAGMAAEKLLTSKSKDSHPCEVADLHGKRLVVASETESGASFNESRLKSLTGGDTIKARRLFENLWEFSPTHKFIIASNYKPAVRGNNHAIWRRLRLVPFTQRFWDENKGETGEDKLKADKKLSTKLEGEFSGILRWLVDGCLAWQRSGLGVPEEVNTATSQYRDEEDSLSVFIAECCETAPDAAVNATELLEAYKEFSGDRSMVARTFAQLLTDKGYRSQRAKSGATKGRVNWFGLRLIAGSEE